MPQHCFTSGTEIATTPGSVLVEHIRVGDVVALVSAAADSVCRVVWVGSRFIDLTATPGADCLAPILIRRGAVSDSVPSRDVLISPDHRIFLAGRLVPARLLVNGMSIIRDLSVASVTYHHIELAQHGVLLADNLPAESFLDEMADRSFFETGTGVTALRPVLPNLNDPAHSPRACAPLAMTPAASRDIWQALHDRAIALGYRPPAMTTAAAPELHLLADATPVFPVHHTATEASFVLPAAPTSLRLVSRASSPSELDRDADDWRILGVAVRDIRYRDATGETVFAADHPALSDGWQDIESDASGAWRWTNGNARLPHPVGAVTITVRFFAQPGYLVSSAPKIEISRAA